MGVPSRFAIEYPERALQLIEVFEGEARRRDLVGSFGLLAAAAVLTIPYERMKATHFLHDERQSGRTMTSPHKSRSSKKKGSSLQHFGGTKPQANGDSQIMASVDRVNDWKDEKGRPSLSADANIIKTRNSGEVIRVLRNALAHGNIIYLDRDGHEIAGNRMVYLAFLSRYEENEEQRKLATTYRVVVTSEDDFLRFVKSWARWVSDFPLHLNSAVRDAA